MKPLFGHDGLALWNASERPPAPTTTSADGVTSIHVRLADGTEARFTGRVAWALAILHAKGLRGVTTLEIGTAPRWSHYVFRLRQAGIQISTEHEHHGGAYSGTHGRYRLAVPITVLDVERGSQRAA